MRSSSFQAWVVNTTSRADRGVVSHSGAYCVQNSRQPIGERAAAPSDINSGCSLAAWTGATASAAASAAPARPAPSISAKLHFILWPLPVLEGHISHKRFESPLIAQSHFEDNASKQHDEYCDHSMRIRLNLNWKQLASRAGITPPTPAGHRSCCPCAIAVNVGPAALATRTPPGTRLTRPRSVVEMACADVWAFTGRRPCFRETRGARLWRNPQARPRVAGSAWQPTV